VISIKGVNDYENGGGGGGWWGGVGGGGGGGGGRVNRRSEKINTSHSIQTRQFKGYHHAGGNGGQALCFGGGIGRGRGGSGGRVGGSDRNKEIEHIQGGEYHHLAVKKKDLKGKGGKVGISNFGPKTVPKW